MPNTLVLILLLLASSVVVVIACRLLRLPPILGYLIVGIVVVFGDKTSPPLVAENLVVSHREDGLYVVGGSPTLRGNHVIGNRRAAVRVLDYVPIHGAPLVGAPLLQGNLLHDNGVDAPVRGEYRESRVRPESR